MNSEIIMHQSEASMIFFKTVQNKMHWAAHGQTAAEKIM